MARPKTIPQTSLKVSQANSACCGTSVRRRSFPHHSERSAPEGCCMNILTHSLVFPCPQCDTAIQITDIRAAADKELVIDGFCATCGHTYMFKTDMDRVVAFCKEADKAAQVNKPLRPPMKELPAPLITAEDRKLASLMHITFE